MSNNCIWLNPSIWISNRTQTFNWNGLWGERLFFECVFFFSWRNFEGVFASGVVELVGFILGENTLLVHKVCPMSAIGP